MDTEIFEDIINQAYSEDATCRTDMYEACEAAYRLGQKAHSSISSSTGLESLFDFLTEIQNLKVHDCHNNGTIFNTDKWIKAGDLREIVEKLSDHLKRKAD